MMISALSLTLAATAPLPVYVTSTAQERMAKRLTLTTQKEINRDARFVLVDRTEPGVLTIALPDGIGWERRLDWTEIHYQVRLTASDGRSQVITGYCWNWDLRVCARQIADAAAQFPPN